MERSIKIDCLAFTDWTRRLRYSVEDSARCLGLRTRTLREWQRRWDVDRLKPLPRGRPLEQSSRETRQVILALFNLMGPGIGLPSLRAFFPWSPKSELEDLLRRYRKVHFWKNKTVVHALRWVKPGTVWAMDFLDAPLPVDGLYRYIFAVRDLASGNQLLALPCPDKDLKAACAALVALFKEHGAPLVLKSDCGFDAQVIQTVTQEYRVTHLLSPPYFPRYNGAIEAGIGSLKMRAHYQAARRDCPGEWNCDDVESARMMANEAARPWGHNAPTPDITWIERNAITDEERSAFLAAVAATEPEARRELGFLEHVPLTRRDEAALKRVAISRTLVAHGLLYVRRRRISLPIKTAFVSNIR
jgi:hypothetical protein